VPGSAREVSLVAQAIAEANAELNKSVEAFLDEVASPERRSELPRFARHGATWSHGLKAPWGGK